jgi:hypothetical protein
MGRHFFAVLAHTLNMKLDGFANHLLNLVKRVAD